MELSLSMKEKKMAIICLIQSRHCRLRHRLDCEVVNEFLINRSRCELMPNCYNSVVDSIALHHNE